MNKERITVTLDPVLVARIQRIAELRDRSRSSMFERLLEIAVEDEERNMDQLASPVLGPIVQSILDHPRIVAAIGKVIGEQLSTEELNKLAEAGPSIRKTREKLKDQRGRRTDLLLGGA